MSPSNEEYSIALFTAISNSLSNIQASMQKTQETVGEIKGIQNVQTVSLKHVEQRLDSVVKHSENKFNELRQTTNEIESKLHSIIPKVDDRQWFQKVFSGENIKIALLILAAIVAIASTIVGVSFPFFK